MRYKKVAFDILLSASTVNALFLFQSVTKQISIIITTFKEQIIKSLLIKPSVPQLISPELKHQLIKFEQKRMCKLYYARISENFGRSEAQKKTRKVYTRCEGC